MTQNTGDYLIKGGKAVEFGIWSRALSQKLVSSIAYKIIKFVDKIMKEPEL